MRIQQITPPVWEEKLSFSPYGTPFHSLEFLSKVSRHLGKEAIFYYAEDENKSWLLPVFFADGFSLAAVGYGGPIPLYSFHKDRVVQEISLLKKVVLNLSSFLQLPFLGSKLFPFAGWEHSGAQLLYTQMIDIVESENSIFTKTLSGNVRTAIRKAEKENIDVRPLDHSTLETAHRLLTETQQTVGAAYTTNYDFFCSLCEPCQQNTIAFGAYDNDNLLAVGLLLYDSRHAIHLFHGWDRSQKRTCANQALLWRLIQFSIEKKCRVFNFGESHSPNLETAKARWGAYKCPILKL